MKLIDYLIEKNVIESEKEFQDLFSVRALKINDQLLIDPNTDINEDVINKIQIGYSVINVV